MTSFAGAAGGSGRGGDRAAAGRRAAGVEGPAVGRAELWLGPADRREQGEVSWVGGGTGVLAGPQKVRPAKNAPTRDAGELQLEKAFSRTKF